MQNQFCGNHNKLIPPYVGNDSTMGLNLITRQAPRSGEADPPNVCSSAPLPPGPPATAILVSPRTRAPIFRSYMCVFFRMRASKICGDSISCHQAMRMRASEILGDSISCHQAMFWSQLVANCSHGQTFTLN